MSNFSKNDWNILKIVAEQHGKNFQKGAKLASFFEKSFPKYQKDILDKHYSEIELDGPDMYKFNMSEEQSMYHLMGFIDAIMMFYEENLIDKNKLLERADPYLYNLSKSDPLTIASLASVYIAILDCCEYFETYEWYDPYVENNENNFDNV